MGNNSLQTYTNSRFWGGGGEGGRGERGEGGGERGEGERGKGEGEGERGEGGRGREALKNTQEHYARYVTHAHSPHASLPNFAMLRFCPISLSDVSAHGGGELELKP